MTDTTLIDVDPDAPITDPCGCNSPDGVHQRRDAAFCRDTLGARTVDLEVHDAAAELERMRTSAQYARLDLDRALRHRTLLLPLCPCTTEPLQECPIDGDGKTFVAEVQQLRAQRDTAPADNGRCPSCEHDWSYHSEPGCWYAVTVGRPDKAMNCPCGVVGPRPAPDA